MTIMPKNGEKPSSANCFSGILRRILCNSTSPTHPSDDHFFTEFQKTKTSNHHLHNHSHNPQDQQVSKPNDHAQAPGIVARLMGLDTLPEINLSTNHQTTFGSFLRSKSVNSLDYLSPPIDLSEKLRHRRIKTFVSFPEEQYSGSAPQGEHDRFFLVRFAKINEEMNYLRGKKQRRVEQSKVHENNGEKFVVKKTFNGVKKDSKRVNINGSNVTIQEKNVSRRTRTMRVVDSREASVRLRFKMLKKNNDFGNKKLRPLRKHSPLRPQVTKPGNSKQTCPKKCTKKFTSIEGPICNSEEVTSKASKCGKQMKTNFESDYFTKMLTNIQRLCEDDINKATPLMVHQVFNFEDLEEICVHFGQQIFELILDQVVDELVMLYLMKSLASFFF